MLAYYEYFQQERALEFLLKLDNKYSADWILGLTPTKREQAMFKIIKEVEKHGKRYRENENKNELNDLLGLGAFSYDAERLGKALDESWVERRSWIRYVMRKIDYLCEAKGGHTTKRGGHYPQSIEYILPHDAPQGSEWRRLFNKGERDGWGGCLGNLVALDRRVSAKLRRSPFTQQKEHYFKFSAKKFTNTAAVVGHAQWNMETLENHHQEIMQLLGGHYGFEYPAPE